MQRVWPLMSFEIVLTAIASMHLSEKLSLFAKLAFL